MPDAPYLSIADVRVRQAAIRNADRFPDVVLEDWRSGFERRLEEFLGYALVTRSVVDERHLVRSGATELVLDHIEVQEVSAVAVAGVAMTGTWRVTKSGVLVVSSGFGCGEVAVSYLHGREPLTGDVRHGCALYIDHEARAQVDPNTGNSYVRVGEGGVIERQSTADPEKGRITGWMDVDRVLSGLRPVPLGFA